MEKQLKIRAIITIALSVLCYMVMSWALKNLSTGKAMLIFAICVIICMALSVYNYLQARDDIHDSIGSYIKATEEEKND